MGLIEWNEQDTSNDHNQNSIGWTVKYRITPLCSGLISSYKNTSRFDQFFDQNTVRRVLTDAVELGMGIFYFHNHVKGNKYQHKGLTMNNTIMFWKPNQFTVDGIMNLQYSRFIWVIGMWHSNKKKYQYPANHHQIFKNMVTVTFGLTKDRRWNKNPKKGNNNWYHRKNKQRKGKQKMHL